MTEKLEVLRAFCITPGKDVNPGDEVDVETIGEGRAAQLCAGSNPKCRRKPAAPPQPEPAVEAEEPVEDETDIEEGEEEDEPADDGPTESAPKKTRRRVPKKLRHR